ncbi:MAG: hypothetical protein K8T26_09415 [Lentisphaerae bacterium]|nr:hypothetical protein [Lentisphaerota bacterium]
MRGETNRVCHDPATGDGLMGAGWPTDAGAGVPPFPSGEGQRPRPNARSGQITILNCFLMYMGALVLFCTLNVAELLTTHVHLQTTVDCAAFSGAVVQARGMNEIARINNQIIELLDVYRNKVWRNGPYSSKSSGNSAAEREARTFRRTNDELLEAQSSANSRYGRECIQTAIAIARRNESAARLEAFPCGHGVLTLLARVRGKDTSFRYRYYYTVRTANGRVRRTGTASGPNVTATVHEQGTSDQTYMCGHLVLPSKAFFFNWQEALPTVFENLRTYGTALPFGGQLWNGRRGVPEYEASLVRTGEVRPRPPIPDRWGAEW